jgi:hypothetical protein
MCVKYMSLLSSYPVKDMCVCFPSTFFTMNRFENVCHDEIDVCLQIDILADRENVREDERERGSQICDEIKLFCSAMEVEKMLVIVI